MEREGGRTINSEREGDTAANQSDGSTGPVPVDDSIYAFEERDSCAEQGVACAQIISSFLQFIMISPCTRIKFLFNCSSTSGSN